MNRMHWSKLGIDLLLGAKLDRLMTADEAMFLPDYLEKGFDSSSIAGTPLVQQKVSLYIKKDTGDMGGNLLTTPAFIFSFILGAVAVLSFLAFRGSVTILAITDFLLFLITGLLGVLLVFMWTGTDHQICANNYNLLWALPTHLIAAFLIRKQTTLAKNYFRFTAILSALLVLAWFFLPQELNPALIPVVLLLGWRAWRISASKK
jgi:amino acid transporter